MFKYIVHPAAIRIIDAVGVNKQQGFKYGQKHFNKVKNMLKVNLHPISLDISLLFSKEKHFMLGSIIEWKQYHAFSTSSRSY